jgi:hypothetical protein
MNNQIRYNRFKYMPGHNMLRDEQVSSTGCPWYAQASYKLITGSVNDCIHKRPWYMQTGV